MKRAILSFLVLFLFVGSLFAIQINIHRLPGEPPVCYEIEVIHDGEPPEPITDFHFSVSMPCQIVEAGGPEGWELRYALPNSFVEMDAAREGSEIPAGGTGTFIVCVEGGCEDATYSLYLTCGGVVIPGTERSGPLGGLGVHSGEFPEYFSLNISPNPFNSACQIIAPVDATIEIFDLQGRRVAQLPEGKSVWQPDEQLGGGIYLVRATKEGCTKIKRVIYLK